MIRHSNSLCVFSSQNEKDAAIVEDSAEVCLYTKVNSDSEVRLDQYFGEALTEMIIPETCENLRTVTIPAAEIEIEARAFDKGMEVTLIGVPGSYTEKYAKGMNLSFEEYEFARICYSLSSL